MDRTPNAATLHTIAHTQSVIAAASAVILHGGVQARQVDRADFTGRLTPALEASHEAWRSAAVTWGTLISPGTRCDSDVLQAASDLRTTLRDLTFDKGGWADPDTMAVRVKAAAVVSCVYQAAAGAADLALVYRDILATDRKLTGFAPAMETVAQRLEAATDDVGRRRQAAWVDPRAIHQRRAVGLPKTVRAAMHRQSGDIVEASQRSQSAAGVPRPPRDSVRRLSQSQQRLQPLPAARATRSR